MPLQSRRSERQWTTFFRTGVLLRFGFCCTGTSAFVRILPHAHFFLVQFNKSGSVFASLEEHSINHRSHAQGFNCRSWLFCSVSWINHKWKFLSTKLLCNFYLLLFFVLLIDQGTKKGKIFLKNSHQWSLKTMCNLTLKPVISRQPLRVIIFT